MQALSSLIAGLPKPLPAGYTAFLRRADGGEGFIGERYVSLWRAEELIGMNGGYNVAQLFPDMSFIAQMAVEKLTHSRFREPMALYSRSHLWEHHATQG